MAGRGFGRGVVSPAGSTIEPQPSSSRRRSSLLPACVLALVTLLVLLALGAQAQAAAVHPYVSKLTGRAANTPFSEEVCGVAVDKATGEVFVGDAGETEEEGPKERGFEYSVDVFGPGGVFVSAIESESNPIEGACTAAINESTGQPTSGYVYVPGEVEIKEDKVEVDDGVEVFAPTLNQKGERTYSPVMKIGGVRTPAGEFSGVLKVAVDDSDGDVYVVDYGTGVIYRFDAEGVYQSQIVIKGFFEAEADPDEGGVAINQTTHALYVAADVELADEIGPSGENEEEWVIDEFGTQENSPGQLLGSFAGPPVGGFGELTGVAIGPNGEIYASDVRDRVVDELDPAGGLLGRIEGTQTPCGEFEEPAGVAVDQAGDVYVADKSESTGKHAVVCIFGPAPTVPTIEHESVSHVKATSATFEAEVNPQGVQTRFYFQWGTAECATSPSSCSVSTAAPGTDIGSARKVQTVVAPERLSSNTTYHYRVVLAYGPSAETVLAGPEQTFTTETEGSGVPLADARAWEMVSPAEKDGAAAEPMPNEGGLIQAAADGTKLAYLTTAPVGEGIEGSRNPEATEVLGTSTNGVWKTRDLTPPHENGEGANAGGPREYRFFSSDLSFGALKPWGITSRSEPPLSIEASEKTLYLRDTEACQTSPAACYIPLVTGKEGYANVPPGTEFGGSAGEGLNFAGANANLSDVLLTSNVALTRAPAASSENIYEWSRQTRQLQLVNVLPNKLPAENPRPGGGANTTVDRNTVSEDGSRVVFYARGHLYMRDMVKEETVALDEVPGVEPPVSPDINYQAATSDDSRVFFKAGSQLTGTATNATPERPDLYVFEVTSRAGEPLAGKLTDLTADVVNQGETAGVQGVALGVGEEQQGQHQLSIYFVADGVFAGGENAEHEQAAPEDSDSCKNEDLGGTGGRFGSRCNLYVDRYTPSLGTWSGPTFISTVSGSDDFPDWGSRGGALGQVTSRVSPNGRYVAFMSDRSLTGYDNRDVTSKAPDEEVFMYDADSARLVCASCNPTGAAPIGVRDTEESGEGIGLVTDRNGIWQANRWLAASVPGWTKIEGGVQLAYYQSRYLSNSGRLFFNSSDALVPQDANGKNDVYEFEPLGVPLGGHACTGSSSSGTAFNVAADGCVGLISSGESDSESAFIDASESGGEAGGHDASEGGGDVFFVTAAKLATADTDTDFDVYDAHECTSESPCPAAAPTTTAPCSTAASSTPESCRGVTPQQSAPAPPSSAISSPSGNLTPPRGTVLPSKVVKLSPAQRLAKALKACRKMKKKKPRKLCEAQAHKRYGPKKKKHKKKRKRPAASGKGGAH